MVIRQFGSTGTSLTRPSIEALLRDAAAWPHRPASGEVQLQRAHPLIADLAAALRSLLTDAETREAEAFKAPLTFTKQMESALAAYRQQQKGVK